MVFQLCRIYHASTSLNLSNCFLLLLQLFLQVGIFFFHLIKLFIVWNLILILSSKVYSLFSILLERNLLTVSKTVKCFLYSSLFEVKLLQCICHILSIQWPILLNRENQRLTLDTLLTKNSDHCKPKYYILFVFLRLAQVAEP